VKHPWRQLQLIGVALLAGCGGGGGDPEADGPQMTLVRVQRDLLGEERVPWKVVSAPAGMAPTVEVLTPSIDNLTDAADRLSLVLPPPSEVRFRVRDEDGPVHLRTAVGVDLALARHLNSASPRGAPVDVDFEVLVDGRSVFNQRVRTAARAPRNDGLVGLEPHVWHHVGGPEGLPLEPGQEVTLRTSLPKAAPPGMERIPAGFAGLVLERRVQRPRRTASAEHPNLVWITVDTERADRTTPYGSPRDTTPALARLAARGLRFEQVYSTSSWTWPSVASLFTGRLPEAHGVVDFRSCYLAEELPTLAEALQEAGWTTGGFSANPLIGPARNFDQGFEHFEVTAVCAKGDEVVPPALRWLEQMRGHRFFLYVHLHDPHVPHTPRPEDLERFTKPPRFPPMLMQARTFELRSAKAHTADDRPRPELVLDPGEGQYYSDVYDALVASADHWTGVLLDQLEAWDLTDNTVIAYTSDHGEELLDHGLLNHNHDLWEELVRVPLVIAGPGLPVGRTRSTPVSNRHLAGTLAGVLGVDFAGPRDGLDLLLELPQRPVFLDTRHGWWKGRQFVEILGVREGDWVLHWCPEGRDWDAPARDAPEGGQWRLFDVGADPQQRHDLAAEQPEKVERLRELILRRRRGLTAERPKRKQRAGAQTMALLEGAGYTGGAGDEEDD
jgi:arylsulfatase A-like enzyme